MSLISYVSDVSWSIRNTCGGFHRDAFFDDALLTYFHLCFWDFGIKENIPCRCFRDDAIDDGPVLPDAEHLVRWAPDAGLADHGPEGSAD